MTQAFNLSQFANKLNTSGQTDNTGLQNSSVTVTAGTGMSGGGAVALGSSVTLTNAGVTSIAAGTGISVSGSTGAVTVTSTVTSTYVGNRSQFFSANGTFTVPTGITALKVTLVGGGGGAGGRSYGGNGAGNGGTGGTTSFGTYVSQTGSTGGGGDNNTAPTPAQGTNGGTPGATLVCTSMAGGALDTFMNAAKTVFYGGTGTSGNGGTSNGYSISFLTGLTPGASVTVTIGAGGSGGSGADGGPSGSAGGPGFVLVEY